MSQTLTSSGPSSANAPTQANPGQMVSLTGLKLYLAAIAVGLGNFLVILDLSIANVSIPNIAGSLGVSVSQGTWVITSYAVAEAITVPLTGWLAKRFGAQRVFISCYFSFGVLSLLCGLSYSLGMLVTARILLGLCGGPLIPLSQMLLLRIFPREKAVLATVIWSMTTLLAPVAGPVLGGIISDGIGWPWIFFINVPVAMIFGSIAYFTLRGQPDPCGHARMDGIGLALLIIWVGAFQIMIDEGRNLDWFSSGFIVTLAIISVIGFIAFMIWELTDKDPIIDLRVFRHRGFTASSFTISVGFGAFFASLIIFPLWLQQNLGYTATWAGYATAIMGISSLICGPPVGKAVESIDSRLLISIGLILLGVSNAWRTLLTPDMTFWQISYPSILAGAGMVMFIIPVSGLAMASVDVEESATAAGIANFMRTIAGAFGAALMQTAWSNSTREANAELAGAMTQGNAVIDTMMADGTSHEAAVANLSNIVESQSVTLASADVFGVIAIIFFCAAGLIWFAPRPNGPIDTSGGH